MEKRFFHLWECMVLVMAIQSCLNSHFQRRSNARAAASDSRPFERIAAETRGRHALTMASQRRDPRACHQAFNVAEKRRFLVGAER